ncbi:hypothetical protein JCM24511_03299 [Saitozyma sp. JCM 24511]|nr:hypothetical protein JCM24511_03299 [Saitozyma sp. JCM 24511]
MSQVKRQSSLSQLQSSISDTLSSALTFVKENPFKSSRSNSPSGSFRSFRIRCEDLCGRVSDDLSRGPTSHPTVIAAQPEPEERPATRRLAADSSLATPTTPTTQATLAQTALQQSDGSTATLASPAPNATFDQDQIQRAARLWATEVPLTDAMSRSDLVLMPSSSRPHCGGELAGTTRDCSRANGSNPPVSRFSLDESSEEEADAEDEESLDYESDEDQQSDEDDKDANEYATVLVARALTVRKFTSNPAMNAGENAGEGTNTDAETENSDSGNHEREKRARRNLVALSACGPSSSGSGSRQAVEDSQSIAEESESEESESVVSEEQVKYPSNEIGMAF